MLSDLLEFALRISLLFAFLIMGDGQFWGEPMFENLCYIYMFGKFLGSIET